MCSLYMYLLHSLLRMEITTYETAFISTGQAVFHVSHVMVPTELFHLSLLELRGIKEFSKA